MSRRGRPEVGTKVKLLFYVMMELERDRRDGRPRDSERNACDRLARHFEKELVVRRKLTAETIRRHVKDFKRILRKSNSDEQAAEAARTLAMGRANREVIGWDASTWLFVLDPQSLKASGVNVLINDQPI
jgi:hypothetical protein